MNDTDRGHIKAAWTISEEGLDRRPEPLTTGLPPDPETPRHFDYIARQATTGAVLTRASDVTPRRTEWFWEGRIPRGKITALDGHPGQGKSTVTMAMAACASTGSPLPGQLQKRTDPTGVIILSAEDEAEDTIVPRLLAHGADTSKIYILDAVAPQGGSPRHLWSLPADIDVLERSVRETGSGLVIIDPFMAYLAGEHDSYRDQDVRSALHPLADMARRTGTAVLLVRHLTKGGTGPALMRGSGSIGIIGAARAGLIVATDPNDDTEQTKVLAVSKMNLGKKGTAIEFRLESADHGCARVHWLRESGHTAETLMVDKGRD